MVDLDSLSVREVFVEKIRGQVVEQIPDFVSVEEPLEIQIEYGEVGKRILKSISVTMRTPGNDRELAIGFLFTEGIISSIRNIRCEQGSTASENIITILLSENFEPDLAKCDRNFYTTSSCGVCGKSSMDSVKTVSVFKELQRPELIVNLGVLYQLPEKLRDAQSGFSATGGIHASGLFDIDGNLILMREDVGRHNALDKLIGNALLNGLLPLQNYILLLSGRASFELIQKAAMAGATIVAAIGAPSSLAVEIAKEFDITLIGFLKESRANIYHTGKSVTIK